MTNKDHATFELFAQTAKQMMSELMNQKQLVELGATHIQNPKEALRGIQMFYTEKSRVPVSFVHEIVFNIGKQRQGLSKVLDLFSPPKTRAFIAIMMEGNGNLTCAVLDTRIRLSQPSRVGLHNGVYYNKLLECFLVGTINNPMPPKEMAKTMVPLLVSRFC